jgi:hypothetical protein
MMNEKLDRPLCFRQGTVPGVTLSLLGYEWVGQGAESSEMINLKVNQTAFRSTVGRKRGALRAFVACSKA